MSAGDQDYGSGMRVGRIEYDPSFGQRKATDISVGDLPGFEQWRNRMLNVVEKHTPREYSLITSDGGIVLCDKRTGALMCFRFAEDVERLRELLATIDVKRLAPQERAE